MKGIPGRSFDERYRGVHRHFESAWYSRDRHSRQPSTVLPFFRQNQKSLSNTSCARTLEPLGQISDRSKESRRQQRVRRQQTPASSNRSPSIFKPDSHWCFSLVLFHPRIRDIGRFDDLISLLRSIGVSLLTVALRDAVIAQRIFHFTISV